MTRGLRVTTAVAGIAAVVLIFAGQFVGAIGARTEPPFDGSTQDIAAFLASLRRGPSTAGTVIILLGLVAFLWFAAGLRGWLSPTTPDAAGVPALAVGAAQLCAVALVAAVVTGGWDLAVLRSGDLDPQIARLIFDEGSVGFANAWVLLGGFAIGAGVAVRAGRHAPGWLGWWALVAGAGMVVARAVWLTWFWLAPYALLWLWVVVACVVLLRRAKTAPVSQVTGPTSGDPPN